MDRKTAAKVAGLAAWEQDRPGMLASSARGGARTVELHGRTHMVRIASRRQGSLCAGGAVQGRQIAVDGRAQCPTCRRRIKIRRYNEMRAHKEAS